MFSCVSIEAADRDAAALRRSGANNGVAPALGRGVWGGSSAGDTGAGSEGKAWDRVTG